MTDRHLHCVYFRYDDPNDASGYCLFKQKRIEFGFAHHCPNIVLRPTEVISYFLRHENYCENWEDADNRALEYIKRIGFNNYPQKIVIHDCKKCYNYNSLIHLDEGIFEQCLMGHELNTNNCEDYEGYKSGEDE